MAVKKRSKKKRSDLIVKRLCGYVAVTRRKGNEPSAEGWLYLRRHSESELFIGNLPAPLWLPSIYEQERLIPQEAQEKVKQTIKRMIPRAEAIGEVFSTGNGRLATRVTMCDGEDEISAVLKAPADHVYMEYWNELRGWYMGTDTSDGRTGVLQTWLEEYEAERDEEKVIAWSNAAMKAYELREKRGAEEKARREKEGAIADEDGFVMVTSGAKQMKAAEAKVATVGKGTYKSKSGRNRKNLLDVNKGIEKVGFYRWQRHKENGLVDLQKKFKEDQKRVAAIRGLGKKSK